MLCKLWTWHINNTTMLHLLLHSRLQALLKPEEAMHALHKLLMLSSVVHASFTAAATLAAVRAAVIAFLMP